MKAIRIRVLTTGGTIEKSYSEEDGAILNRESIFKDKLLRKLRLPHTLIEVEQIMAKDSLDMNDSDREVIYKKIAASVPLCDAIVVLHGTDTVDKTIQHCLAKVAHPMHPVVFTGAMRPAGFDDSDAQQNLTEALMAATILPAGFFLSFHGRIFAGGKFRKDLKLKTFVESV